MSNKDIFDRFNVTYPTDGMLWDEAIDLAAKLTKSEDGVQYYGLLIGNHGTLKSQMGLTYFGDQGKANVTIDPWQKIAQTYKKLNDIPNNFTTVNTRNAFTKDRNAAMILTNSSFLLRNPIPDLNWDFVTSPTFENKLLMDQLGATLTISSTSKKKDAAFQVISVYFSDEVQKAVARTAALVPVHTSEEIISNYGVDVPENAGKNLKADFTGTAAVRVVEINSSLATPIVNKAFLNIAKGEQDINTALREANELIDQAVAAAGAKE